MGSQGDPQKKEEGEGGGGRGSPPASGQEPDSGGPQEEEEEEDGPPPKRKKPYRRHPKPPYSFVALIALAIQASPEKRLKLAQILREMERLFPLFRAGGYQGWRDSVRHNLSSNPCFLKEETNHGKGKWSFWRVDVAQIPPGLLKRQNVRGGPKEGAEDPPSPSSSSFVPDLSPFILHGEPFPPSPVSMEASPTDLGRPQRKTPKKDGGTPFRIEDLLLRLGEEDSPLGHQRSPDPGPGVPPPLLHDPCLPPPCSWGQPFNFYGVGLAPQGVAHCPLTRPPYPFPLPPAPGSRCLDPHCPLGTRGPSPALPLGHPLAMGPPAPGCPPPCWLPHPYGPAWPPF